jgi:hypothetical protein
MALGQVKKFIDDLDIVLDINPTVDPDEPEIALTVEGVELLTVEVTTEETTLNLLGFEIAEVSGDLSPLLEPLDAFEASFGSLSNKDLKNLEFDFNVDDGTGTATVLIDNKKGEEILMQAILTEDETTITFDEVEATVDVDLTALFPALNLLDLYV